jgi:TonB family protein
MLPRALLFSPDKRVEPVVAPLFAELGLEVQQCNEIFAAVEQLTQQHFVAVLADWTQELEAAFFLKTACELKSNKPGCALAVVEQKDIDAALQMGADGVLTKPLIPAQIRNTLSALDLANLVPLDDELPEDESPVIPPIANLCIATAATDAKETAEFGMPVCPATQPQNVLLGPGDCVAEETPSPVTPLTPGDVLSFASSTQDLATRLISKRPRTRNQARLLILSSVTVLLCLVWKMGYLPAGLLTEPAKVVAEGVAAIGEFVNPYPDNLASRGASVPPAPEVSAPDNQKWGAFDDTPTVATADVQVTPIVPPVPASTTASPNLEPALAIATLPVPAPESTSFEKNQPTPHPVVRSRGVSPQIPTSLLVPALAAPTTSAPAPSERWTAQPVLLPEEMSRAMLVYRTPLVYPAEALKAGLEGSVSLQAWVGKDGSIRDLKLLTGYLVLGRAAFDSVRQWRFKPYRQNGEIVETQTLITVNFRHP